MPLNNDDKENGDLSSNFSTVDENSFASVTTATSSEESFMISNNSEHKMLHSKPGKKYERKKQDYNKNISRLGHSRHTISPARIRGQHRPLQSYNPSYLTAYISDIIRNIDSNANIPNNHLPVIPKPEINSSSNPINDHVVIKNNDVVSQEAFSSLEHRVSVAEKEIANKSVAPNINLSSVPSSSHYDSESKFWDDRLKRLKMYLHPQDISGGKKTEYPDEDKEHHTSGTGLLDTTSNGLRTNRNQRHTTRTQYKSYHKDQISLHGSLDSYSRGDSPTIFVNKSVGTSDHPFILDSARRSNYSSVTPNIVPAHSKSHNSVHSVLNDTDEDSVTSDKNIKKIEDQHIKKVNQMQSHINELQALISKSKINVQAKSPQKLKNDTVKDDMKRLKDKVESYIRSLNCDDMENKHSQSYQRFMNGEDSSEGSLIHEMEVSINLLHNTYLKKEAMRMLEYKSNVENIRSKSNKTKAAIEMQYQSQLRDIRHSLKVEQEKCNNISMEKDRLVTMLQKENDILRQQLESHRTAASQKLEMEIFKARSEGEKVAAEANKAMEISRLESEALLSKTILQKESKIQEESSIEIKKLKLKIHELQTQKESAAFDQVATERENNKSHISRLHQLREAHEVSLSEIRTKAQRLSQEHNKYVKALRAEHATALSEAIENAKNEAYAEVAVQYESDSRDVRDKMKADIDSLMAKHHTQLKRAHDEIHQLKQEKINSGLPGITEPAAQSEAVDNEARENLIISLKNEISELRNKLVHGGGEVSPTVNETHNETILSNAFTQNSNPLSVEIEKVQMLQKLSPPSPMSFATVEEVKASGIHIVPSGEIIAERENDASQQQSTTRYQRLLDKYIVKSSV